MKYIFDRISLEPHEISAEEEQDPNIISSTRIPVDLSPEPEQRCCVARPITAEGLANKASRTSGREKDLHSKLREAGEETQYKISPVMARKTGPVKVFSTAVDETVRVSTHQVPIQQIRRAEPSPRHLVPTHNVISNKDFEIARVPRPGRKEAYGDDLSGADMVSTLTKRSSVHASRSMEKSNPQGLHMNDEEFSFLESSVSDCKRVPSSTAHGNRNDGSTFPNNYETHTSDDSNNDYLYTVTSTVRHPSLIVDDIRIFEVKGAISERRKRKDYDADSCNVIKIDMPPKLANRDTSTPFMSNTSPMETNKYTRSGNNTSMTFNKATAVRVTPSRPEPAEVTASYANHRAAESTHAIHSIETPVKNPVMHSGVCMVENDNDDVIDTDFRVVEASISDSTHSDYSDGNYCVQSRIERIRRAPIKENTYSVIKGTAARVPAPKPSVPQNGDDLRCFILTFVDTEPRKFN